MADLTASQAAFNSGVTLTMNSAAASQTINMFDTADERALLIVQNGNTTSQTATVTVAPGGFQSSVQGTLSVAVGPGAIAAVGPLEGVRFKGTNSKVTVGVTVAAAGTVSNVKLGVVRLP